MYLTDRCHVTTGHCYFQKTGKYELHGVFCNHYYITISTQQEQKVDNAPIHFPDFLLKHNLIPDFRITYMYINF